MQRMKIKVQDIRENDVFGDASNGWVAEENAQYIGKGQRTPKRFVRVQVGHMPDGGRAVREWSNPDHEIEIQRP